jgi:hypothetical protein
LDPAHPLAADLSRIEHHFGGEPAVFEWLERHPGRPRLVARLYALVALLDELTDKPAVLTAVGELRERRPYPPGLVC